jgi:acetoin utilization deacetylase AcuC-like enzyme
MAIMKELEKSRLLSITSGCRLVKPHLASLEDVGLVHTREHIELVRRICEQGGGVLDLGDTVVSPESFKVARYAVGGVLKAVNLVLSRKFRNAFALVRPPGHHAGPYYAAGFCVFNNVAVAAAHLVKRSRLKRVLIIDVDAHHGNGTQEIFYDSKEVLYISMHEDPSEFPGTGFIDEVGEGKGLGYNVNIPFPFGVGDKTYMRAIDDIVVPISRQYAPQFILISAGYDAYREDPVAQLSLSAAAFPSIFRKILGIAATVCEQRVVAVLEGGYNLRFLGELVASTVSELAGLHYSLSDEKQRAELRGIERKAEKVLEEVKKVQSAFWNLSL